MPSGATQSLLSFEDDNRTLPGNFWELVPGACQCCKSSQVPCILSMRSVMPICVWRPTCVPCSWSQYTVTWLSCCQIADSHICFAMLYRLLIKQGSSAQHDSRFNVNEKSFCFSLRSSVCCPAAEPLCVRALLLLTKN